MVMNIYREGKQEVSWTCPLCGDKIELEIIQGDSLESQFDQVYQYIKYVDMKSDHLLTHVADAEGV